MARHIENININIDYLTNLFINRQYNLNEDKINSMSIVEFIDTVVKLFNNRKHQLQQLNELRAQHNINSSNINMIEMAKKTKQELQIKENEFNALNERVELLLSLIPANLHYSVPKENEIIESVGEIKSKINQFDFDGVISNTIFGAKLIVKTVELCRIERALINWCMTELRKHDFIEYSIPSLIKLDILYEVGHLPHAKNDMFLLDKYGLSPTGEVGLMAWLSHQNHTQEKFICTVNQCYRGESGASGVNNKGLYRMHEFTKCEMVAITMPENSYNVLEKIKNISANLIKSLGLPMRVIKLGQNEVGSHSSMTYDVESCVNGQWTEVASISNCENYQTLGSNIKINGKIAHSLNGTAIALSRVLAAIIECYYDKTTNSIMIPEVLKPYYF